jgi:hypothetical protein
MRIADLAFVFLVAADRAVDVDRQHGIALPNEKVTLVLLTGFPGGSSRQRPRSILRQPRTGFSLPRLRPHIGF